MTDTGFGIEPQDEETLRRICGSIRERAPLIHCITNYVTVNDCANALLAVGARPVMSHAPQEAAEITSASDALVLNLGGTEYMDAMFLSAAAAKEKGIPVVIDPVGIGGSSWRREKLKGLMEICTPAVIRGNRAEIGTLVGTGTKEAGVDYTGDGHEMKRLAAAAGEYALEHGMVLAATGTTDIVTDGRTLKLSGLGDPEMSRVTGTGCMSSALLGAFLAAGRSLGYSDAVSCTAQIHYMGMAGKRAGQRTKELGGGTGTYRVQLIDALDRPGWDWQ